MDLCGLLDIQTVSADIVASRKAALATFDQLLKETQCYVSFFCSCGPGLRREGGQGCY
jgi:hypothetical protein